MALSPVMVEGSHDDYFVSFIRFFFCVCVVVVWSFPPLGVRCCLLLFVWGRGCDPFRGGGGASGRGGGSGWDGGEEGWWFTFSPKLYNVVRG